MFREPIPCHLTVMVMVENQKQELLTLNRLKSWPGITFPGGHLERGESFLDCARREVLEETGILICELRLKGLIHWFNRDNGERYLVYCVAAKAQGGTLRDSPEGRAAWLSLQALKASPLAAGFEEQLRMFLEPDPGEAFGTYGAAGDSELRFDHGGKEEP